MSKPAAITATPADAAVLRHAGSGSTHRSGASYGNQQYANLGVTRHCTACKTHRAVAPGWTCPPPRRQWVCPECSAARKAGKDPATATATATPCKGA